MTLLLLAGGEDDRRIAEARAVERAHRVAEPRRDMDITGGQPARRTREPVGHRDNGAFLQAEHEADVLAPAQRFHDRKLGGAGVAEEMIDTLVHKDGKECVPS